MIAGLTIIFYWISAGVQILETVSKIFVQDGSLKAQPVYRVLTFDPEQRLVHRLLIGPFRELYGSLEKFQKIVSFREIPLQVIAASQPSYLGKFRLRFDQPTWRNTPENGVTGPRIAVQSADVQ